MTENKLTYSVIIIVAIASFSVFLLPSTAYSNTTQSILSTGNSTQTATAVPTQTVSPTSTNTPTPESATSTPTESPASTSTMTSTSTQTPVDTDVSSSETSTQTANLSAVTPIFEVEQNGDRIMISLQGTDKIDKSVIEKVEVNGITVNEPISLDEDYPTAQGRIDRPTTVEIVFTFDDGSKETLASKHYD